MLLLLNHQRPDGEVDTYHLKPGRKYHIGRGSSCEVRILDLSLSRKHCALEYIENQWALIDLLSTNGCKLNGDQVVGSLPVIDGASITAGQTTLAVTLRTPGSSCSSSAGPAAPHHPTPVLEQESLPDDGPGCPRRPEPLGDNRDWEPQSAAAKASSGVLVPRQLDIPYGQPLTEKAEKAEKNEKVEKVENVTPVPTLAKPVEDRRYVISLLGQRVGPLTHAEARQLKAREQAGQLTNADLERYPRQ